MPKKKASTKSAKKTTKRAAKKTAKTTKKTAQKTATKRARSTQTKRPSGRALVCAADGHCFWTTDGQILSNLAELRDALAKMEKDVYAHHVTKEKNDFADWVEHVLEDAECAAAMRGRRTPGGARTVVVRHLRLYAV